MDVVSSRLSTFEYCKNHMTEAVAGCEVSDNPFPHFIVRNFFPADVYDAMLRQLPERKHYFSFEYSKHQKQGSETRWCFDMKDATIEKSGFDPQTEGFWLGVRDALGCPELKRAVFARLSAGLSYRFSIPESKTAEIPGFPSPALYREEKGYSIKPHPDTRKKIVTMQIALPEDETQKHLGTQFYRRSFNPLSLAREPRGFDIIKSAPFTPNTAYAFVVLNTITWKSWHGRTKLASVDGIRNSILNIWHTEPQYGHPDVVRDHYQAKQRAA